MTEEDGKELTVLGLDKENISGFSHLLTENAKEEILAEDGTTAFVAKLGDQYAGALAGRFISPARYQISSIYVKKDCRRQGVGSFLLETLHRLFEGKQVEVSAEFVMITKEEQLLEPFFEKAGFEEYLPTGGHVFVTDLQAVSELKIMSMNVKQVHTLVPFCEMSSYLFHNMQSPEKGVFMPLPEGGFSDPGIDRELSLGCVEDKKLMGYAIVEVLDEDILMLSHLYMDKALLKTALPMMLKQLKENALKKFKPDTKLYIPVVNPDLENWLEDIFRESDIDDAARSYRLSVNVAEGMEFDYENGSLSEFLDFSDAELTDYLFYREQ